MLELTYQQLLIIASWPYSPETEAFKSGLGKLVAKGELIKIQPVNNKAA